MDIQKHYKSFFGKNADYYLNKISLYKKQGKRLSFNSGAFFVSILWLLYRKMYKHAIVLFLSVLFIDYLISVMIPLDDNVLFYIDILITVFIALFFGFYGNYLYFLHSEKIIYNIIKEERNSNTIENLISKKGRTNLVLPIIFILLYLIFYFFILSR